MNPVVGQASCLSGRTGWKHCSTLILTKWRSALRTVAELAVTPDSRSGRIGIETRAVRHLPPDRRARLAVIGEDDSRLDRRSKRRRAVAKDRSPQTVDQGDQSPSGAVGATEKSAGAKTGR